MSTHDIIIISISTLHINFITQYYFLLQFPQISDHYPIATTIHCGSFRFISEEYEIMSFHGRFSEDEEDQKF